MTGRDKFPFGKPKEQGLTLDDVLGSPYLSWLETQGWWTDPKGRWKDHRSWLQAAALGEDEELTTQLERSNLNVEAELFKTASEDFKAFWARAYGERLRRDGEIQYVTLLRVALTSWNACTAVASTKETTTTETVGPITLE